MIKQICKSPLFWIVLGIVVFWTGIYFQVRSPFKPEEQVNAEFVYDTIYDDNGVIIGNNAVKLTSVGDYPTTVTITMTASSNQNQDSDEPCTFSFIKSVDVELGESVLVFYEGAHFTTQNDFHIEQIELRTKTVNLLDLWGTWVIIIGFFLLFCYSLSEADNLENVLAFVFVEVVAFFFLTIPITGFIKMVCNGPVKCVISGMNIF